MHLKKIRNELSIKKYKFLLFLFLLLPYITDYIEGGHFPGKPSEWLTEIVMTCVILFNIFIIYRQINQLEKNSFIDHLTGISNRRQFEIDLQREIMRSRRRNDALILIFFDLDGFKKINDVYGHSKGDEVLIEFAKCLLEFIRSGSDFCYRFGGDEFALVLTDINSFELEKIENLILTRLDKIVFSKLPEGVSASHGLVFLNKNETFNEFVKRADETMYKAKKENKVNI